MKKVMPVVSTLILVAGIAPRSAAAAPITLPYSGEGVVRPSLCSPDQVDPAACFHLEEPHSPYVLNGEAGWNFAFLGEIVPNPDPDAFPFPTYIGTGTWALSKGPDSLMGIWRNLFIPAAPPPGCDPSDPIGNPLCFDAVSVALFDYVVQNGTGVYLNAIGTGRSRVEITAGFPPGNIADPATGSPFVESGVLVLVPEPGALALITLGFLGAGLRRCRR
jgi:hypothetical protein